MPDPRKILLVDDDVDHLTLCKLVLTNRGFNVLVLWNTGVLLEVVKDFMPDLIFMDHNMPGMTGQEATQLLKSTNTLQQIPVIYFSGAENAGDLARSAGADGFLEKPFKVERMIEMIDRFL